ncbi:hypothetical protein SEA_CHUNKY_50 [Mycobacterium phage Chunky]|nr:hypothetical protein SEA_CHUNKY_50 [Mycobacterium phage Chunky]
MAGSPFSGKGGAATAAAPAPSKGKVDPTDLPDVTNVGEDKPVGADPYAAADPTGVSGYKPAFFLGQLVLMHPTEYGTMATVHDKDGKESEFVRFDIIPLTVPEPGTPNAQTAVRLDNGNFGFLNRDGEVEECEPYEVGERLDDIMVFNKALAREGKKALDRGIAWVLGRIVKGVKKPNQSAPFILVAGSEEDKALYQQWRQSLAKA